MTLFDDDRRYHLLAPGWLGCLSDYHHDPYQSTMHHYQVTKEAVISLPVQPLGAYRLPHDDLA
jgi:hypothetical protein